MPFFPIPPPHPCASKHFESKRKMNSGLPVGNPIFHFSLDQVLNHLSMDDSDKTT